MKKFLTILVVFTVVCSTVRANDIDPNSPVGMGIIKNGSIMKVFYKGLKEGDVSVTITNAEGNIVFKERLKHIQSFMRPYNFSNLGEGDYTIKIDSEDGKQQQTVSLKAQSATTRIVSLSRVAKISNKYILSIPYNRSEELQISIYNKQNTLVHSSKVNVDDDFAVVYDLESVGEGFYFEISGDDHAIQTISYQQK
jgi:hypothetical protein